MGRTRKQLLAMRRKGQKNKKERLKRQKEEGIRKKAERGLGRGLKERPLTPARRTSAKRRARWEKIRRGELPLELPEIVFDLTELVKAETESALNAYVGELPQKMSFSIGDFGVSKHYKGAHWKAIYATRELIFIAEEKLKKAGSRAFLSKLGEELKDQLVEAQLMRQIHLERVTKRYIRALGLMSRR